MAEIHVEIKNLAEIKRAFKAAPARMTKNLNIAIRQTVLFIRAGSVRNAPVRTGNLRGSAYQSFGVLKGEIGFKAKYALFVHDGTSPYTITPRSAKALYWKGASHPVRRVKHPGIKANPFLKRAIEDGQPQIDKFFEKAVQDTLDTVAKEIG